MCSTAETGEKLHNDDGEGEGVVFHPAWMSIDGDDFIPKDTPSAFIMARVLGIASWS
jgi:hypothetical protein